MLPLMSYWLSLNNLKRSNRLSKIRMKSSQKSQLTNLTKMMTFKRTRLVRS